MVNLTINRTTHAVDADPDMPLLWALRDLLNLTGRNTGVGSPRAAPARSTSTGSPCAHAKRRSQRPPARP
jgi:isoquinoline 1-oxidoreductase alpha subunit